jgi:putative FmdB family regulatory protein
MPKYEYRCDVCSVVLEIFREFSDVTEIMCCQKPMQRLWSSPAVHFKGTGWGKDA